MSEDICEGSWISRDQFSQAWWSPKRKGLKKLSCDSSAYLKVINLRKIQFSTLLSHLELSGLVYWETDLLSRPGQALIEIIDFSQQLEALEPLGLFLDKKWAQFPWDPQNRDWGIKYGIFSEQLAFCCPSDETLVLQLCAIQFKLKMAG